MAFTWTTIADFILDDFFGFAEYNQLKNNAEYIQTDILGDPAGNSDVITLSEDNANSIIDTYTRPAGTSVAERGVAISANSGNYIRTNSSYQQVTNLSVTITTSGRPVMVMLTGGSSSTDGYLRVDKNGAAAVTGVLALLRAKRDTTVISETQLFLGYPSATGLYAYRIPPSSFAHVDSPAAGTYTYTIEARSSSTNDTIWVEYVSLVVFEL